MAALLLAYVLFPPLDDRPLASTSTSLGTILAHRVSLMDDGDPYRAPTATERAIGVQALQAREDGKRPAAAAARIGITASVGVDATTGRPYSMLASETETNRAWGVVILDRSKPLSLVIEIPHPKDDINTALVGLDLFRKVPGSALIVAGATRHAGKDADVAHAANSMFQAYAGHLAVQTGREVQVHGFVDKSLPGIDAIPSPGPTSATLMHTTAGTALTVDGIRSCMGWTSNCGNLLGTENVQGAAAKARGSKFLHIETSRTARDSATDRAKIASAIGTTWG